MEQEKNLEYWKKNAEEDYMKVPISVLRYITEMELALRKHGVIKSVCDCDAEKKKTMYFVRNWCNDCQLPIT